MNDFTKEELDELRASRCYHMDDNFPYEDKLFMKLQSMIDNYCDHEAHLEYMLHTHVEDLFRGNEDKVLLCKKCERYYL